MFVIASNVSSDMTRRSILLTYSILTWIRHHPGSRLVHIFNAWYSWRKATGRIVSVSHWSTAQRDFASLCLRPSWMPDNAYYGPRVSPYHRQSHLFWSGMCHIKVSHYVMQIVVSSIECSVSSSKLRQSCVCRCQWTDFIISIIIILDDCDSIIGYWWSGVDWPGE